MGKSDPPAPPDPRQTSAAQTGTNVATAIANSMMGNVDQVTPYGGLTYEQTDTYQWRDPFTGESYEIPRFTATTTLNDQQQATLDANQAAQGNLSNLAQERSGFLMDYLPNQDDITSQIDERLFDLGRQRLDPMFARRDEDLRTRLANQGIKVGTEAYDREMELLGQQQNDAYNQLLLSGRGQALAEVNQPLNQITALLSGSQVQNPNVSMAQQSRIPTTDNAAIINNNYNQQMNQWQQEQAARGSMLSGAGGLFAGLGGLGWSPFG